MDACRTQPRRAPQVRAGAADERGARLGTPTAERLFFFPWPSAPRPSSGSTSTRPASLPRRSWSTAACASSAPPSRRSSPGSSATARSPTSTAWPRRCGRCTARTRACDKRVRVGLANQKIVVRVIDLPYLEDAKELDAAVRFQAQDQLPMPLEHAVLDHQPLAVVNDADGRRQRVLLVAARREMVERVLAALRSAGPEARGRRPLRLRHGPRAAPRRPRRRARPLPRHRRPHQPRGRPRHRVHLRPRLRQRRRGPRRRARRARRADARARLRLAGPRRRAGPRRGHHRRSPDRRARPPDPARRRAPDRLRGAQLAGLPPHAGGRRHGVARGDDRSRRAPSPASTSRSPPSSASRSSRASSTARPPASTPAA